MVLMKFYNKNFSSCKIACLITTIVLLNGFFVFTAFARPSFVNKSGIKFVKIKTGSFLMGSPPSELGRKWDEKRHKVSITRSFYMSATEITQSQWFKIMKYNPAAFKECGGNCPVESVSWNDCQEFIKKLNKIEGTTQYRLPTEAEWEYACRAGSKTAFANGDITVSQCDIDPNLDKMGWYCGNTGFTKPIIYDLAPKPVGYKKPNAWGLFDMHGNVNEWCLDSCKTRSLLRTGVVTDTYGKDKITNPLSKKGPNRVFRGGSWNTSAKYSRSANRGSFLPPAKRSYLGFRIIKEQ